MSRRSFLIAAYGDEKDRQRAAAVASAEDKSVSTLLIDYIRTRYQKLFGDVDPDKVIPK